MKGGEFGQIRYRLVGGGRLLQPDLRPSPAPPPGSGEEACPECPDYAEAPYTYGLIAVEADHILEAFRKGLLTDDDGYALNEDEDPKSTERLPGRGVLYLPDEQGQCIYEGPFFGSDEEPIIVGVACEEVGTGQVYVGDYGDARRWVLRDAAGTGIRQITL